jgi:hypothetical protein
MLTSRNPKAPLLSTLHQQSASLLYPIQHLLIPHPPRRKNLCQ